MMLKQLNRFDCSESSVTCKPMFKELENAITFLIFVNIF